MWPTDRAGLVFKFGISIKIRIWFLIKIYDVIIKINRIHLGLELQVQSAIELINQYCCKM